MPALVQSLLILYFLIGIISVVFVAPSMYSLALSKIGTGGNLDTKDKVLCFVPIVNLYHSRMLYSYSRFSFAGLGAIVTLIGFIVRIVSIFIIKTSEAGTFFILGLYVSLIFGYLFYMIDVASVVLPMDARLISGLSKVLLILVPPVSMIYIGAFMYNKVRKYEQDKSRALKV